MNIFYLDRDPVRAAQMMCDKHVVKMILETTQLLWTAVHVAGVKTSGIRAYRKTHVWHPTAMWVRESPKNWKVTEGLGRASCARGPRRHTKPPRAPAWCPAGACFLGSAHASML